MQKMFRVRPPFFFLTACVLLPLATAFAAPGAEEVHSSTRIVNGYVYVNPGLWTAAKNQVGDQKDFWRAAFQKDNVPLLIGLGASTGLLIAADQRLYEGTYRLGTRWGISHAGQQKPFMKTKLPGFNYTIRLSGPHDVGTGIYFLGDGITHFSIAAGFIGTGFAAHDPRALQTGSQLVEAIFTTGIVVQVLKHVTGREDPVVGTSPGGKWRFFPNQKDYAKHVNHYDAYPSGHLATAMATVSVIAMNYPEYEWIRPVGYTLMVPLAFQMVNNGVHWYSDYPLALALGYGFAKIAVGKGRSPAPSAAADGDWTAVPAPVGGAPGLVLIRRFG